MFQLNETKTIHHSLNHFVDFIKRNAIPWKFLDYEFSSEGVFQYEINESIIILRYIPKMQPIVYKLFFANFKPYIILRYKEQTNQLDISIKNSLIANILLVSFVCFMVFLIPFIPSILMSDQMDVLSSIIAIIVFSSLIGFVVFARKSLQKTKKQFDIFIKEYLRNH